MTGWAQAQTIVDVSALENGHHEDIVVNQEWVEITWPIENNERGSIRFNLSVKEPLIENIQLSAGDSFEQIFSELDPVFFLTEGQRDLSKESGWNIFFDRTAYKPYNAYKVILDRRALKVSKNGARTIIQIDGASAGSFKGRLEIVLYHGSALVNMAAVMATPENEKAIIYDAGFTSGKENWKEIFWSDTEDYLQSFRLNNQVTCSKNLPVKYRTIIGESSTGSIAVFPPPHQYFYPLDNAYNLQHVWYGEGYRDLEPGFGIGIRHDLLGDRRHVPWFNAPPGTEQRLNFFCYLSRGKDGSSLAKVKEFTHSDRYKPLDGFKTMASHFHTEHIDDVLTHKPIPEIPGHVKALRKMGVNIMHLGEFHLAGNPGDDGPRRLPEFQMMFEECSRLSSGDFLMLPGEEPNSHFGGHWMNIFPKPVYWIMSRNDDQPFVEDHPIYGKVYRVGNKDEMLRLLELEKGLAWTAHARTKGSTGFPDKYNKERFFVSDRFLGAAWKSIPADLSIPRMGERVLDLIDDMANWGHQKYVIGEADLFKLEPDYEIYGHMNINYLEMDKLPKFEDGWQPILDAMEKGKFFVSTGEVLLPKFSVNGKKSGETVRLGDNALVEICIFIDWTFPLNFIEIIFGDGKDVHRKKLDLSETEAFGNKYYNFMIDLKDQKWVRAEVWDVAVNGAFTQTVWLE
ncbi:CehA/McbA family metallohydrolase domain-containing protein [Anditalea andensis]|uniref:Uncharacterized protein n=1 Tax=Anditalea andensis TaxID=1048983 RepID=A0A074L094_9BACT|nr:hypothetical protein [Anditalea andensis]KEO75631.1 hypothetical protein EL17_23685 [Anditalea andensis]